MFSLFASPEITKEMLAVAQRVDAQNCAKGAPTQIANAIQNSDEAKEQFIALYNGKEAPKITQTAIGRSLKAVRMAAARVFSLPSLIGIGLNSTVAAAVVAGAGAVAHEHLGIDGPGFSPPVSKDAAKAISAVSPEALNAVKQPSTWDMTKGTFFMTAGFGAFLSSIIPIATSLFTGGEMVAKEEQAEQRLYVAIQQELGNLPAQRFGKTAGNAKTI